MTAQKYLASRAVAAQRTWARFIPGRVEFFSSQGSAAPLAGPGLPPLPVVALPGVDDAYPPQKKSFMMLKYMHDHYLDRYEWFMRADDDVYIKGDLGGAQCSVPPGARPGDPSFIPDPRESAGLAVGDLTSPQWPDTHPPFRLWC
uniref:Hexosyltransferase n=1 Tax=Pelusios castaneus TaxID=367368 RepID=A0A8C8RYA5_9SAUR